MAHSRREQVDDARVLPRFRGRNNKMNKMLDEQRKALVDAVVAAASEGRAVELPSRHVKLEPGELRGIPVVGRSSGGGAIRGSDPLGETIRREAARERRR